MEVKPESATVQEGHDSFDTYKAAGKVSVLVIQAMFCRNRDGCQEGRLTIQLVGKKAIVTGGDSGIGRAAAVMFAMEGADVSVLCSLHHVKVSSRDPMERSDEQPLQPPTDSPAPSTRHLTPGRHRLPARRAGRRRQDEIAHHGDRPTMPPVPPGHPRQGRVRARRPVRRASVGSDRHSRQQRQCHVLDPRYHRHYRRAV